MKTDLSELRTKPPKGINKEDIIADFIELQQRLAVLQNIFFAESTHSLLIIFQGIDASGKDGVIRKVFTTTNPLGVKVKSFKAPTEEEKKHDFLWRIYPYFPKKGQIYIHNRSYYEDIIMPLLKENLPDRVIKNRIKLINNLEKNLVHSDTKVLKFFLHISEDEQHERIDERKNNPDKQWKYQPEDVKAMKRYDDYLKTYEFVFEECSKAAPWHIIPADKKWYRNYLVARKLVETLEKLVK
ncbi:MAG: PPK2 family polyphosphate kinase [Bacteroidia bacterium]